MTRIKICGLKRREDISYVNEYRPDYIGFVFFPKSSRYVTPAKAKELKKILHPDIRSVGVFVDEDIDSILKLCTEHVIDLIQLHGNEDEDDIRRLKSFTDIPVIKAIRVQNSEQLLAAENLPCDYLLLDTFVKDLYGGSGKTFDRTLIPKDYREFFLAGGLNAQNIADAIRECHPYCVDLSSSVEINGYKDADKIKEMIDIVKAI